MKTRAPHVYIPSPFRVLPYNNLKNRFPMPVQPSTPHWRRYRLTGRVQMYHGTEVVSRPRGLPARSVWVFYHFPISMPSCATRRTKSRITVDYYTTTKCFRLRPSIVKTPTSTSNCMHSSGYPEIPPPLIPCSHKCASCSISTAFTTEWHQRGFKQSPVQFITILSYLLSDDSHGPAAEGLQFFHTVSPHERPKQRTKQ